MPSGLAAFGICQGRAQAMHIRNFGAGLIAGALVLA